MNDIKKSVRRIFWLFMILFAAVFIYFMNFMLRDSKNIITSSYNPRLTVLDKSIKRGDILDINSEVLVYSERTGDEYSRVYPYARTFSHVIGYSELGKSGVESKYNFEMQKLDMEIVQRLKNIISGTELTGNNIVLTLDAGLQKLVSGLLNGKKGAIIIMEPSTGRIKAMASYPDFEPSSIMDQWDSLRSDTENSPLLNRAAQGLYPPGSTFKIITSLAEMRNIPDYAAFSHECNGESMFGENRMRCSGNKAHGLVAIDKAFAVSCNTYYSSAGLEIGGERLKEAAEALYFNKPYNYPLTNRNSSFALNGESSISEIIETSIGQGKTLTSPLHMVMIASAIANNGTMMEPYLLECVKTYTGRTVNTTEPKVLNQVMTEDEAQVLTRMMTEAVTNGSGANAAIKGVKIAGKTGTAQNSSGEDHGWFVAFAPADAPRVAVCVLLENSGGSGTTLPIARKIFEYILDGG